MRGRTALPGMAAAAARLAAGALPGDVRANAAGAGGGAAGPPRVVVGSQ